MNRFFYYLLLLPAFAMAYVIGEPSKEATKDPEPSDFDYDLFNRDQRTVFINAEFLYWTLDENALDYAIKMKSPSWGPTPSYAQGDYKIANYNFDPGYRIGVGFFNAPKFWMVFGQYTWLHLKGKDSVKAPDEANEFLTGTWPQVFTNPLSRATSHIHFHYNLFDYLVARVFHPNPHLRLRFFGGLSFPWMHQLWKVRYYDTTDQETFIKNRWSFWGAGPKIGLSIDWYWFKHIYIAARTSFAATVGNYKNQSFQQTTSNPSGNDDPNIPIRNAHYNDTRSALNFNFSLGPSWQYCFCSSRWEVFLGYEFTDWLNLQEIYRSTAASPFSAKETWINNGQLTLHGLTARLSADF
ncbi:MAG: Lpg1974 family pore-forming outer membrane protein [Simkaniaceae bacterium]